MDVDNVITIRVLRPNSRNLICKLLNPEMCIPAESGVSRYWRGLAALCKINPTYEASLAENPNPTNEVLNLWYENEPKESTIHQLYEFLEKMDRFDVIADVSKLVDEDIKLYKENPEIKPFSLEADKYIITTDDVTRINNGLTPERYDAFLLYDQDDIEFAIDLLEKMEKDYNMKFCVKDRDVVGGGLEIDKMITLITERCNRLVVILSDNFFKSSANDYFLKFAQAYGIESQRKIIPCIYKNLEVIPTHVRFLFILDHRRKDLFNFWDRLRDSIRVADPTKINLNRSKSDNSHALKNGAVTEKANQLRLRPIQHAVKFSSSVGDLNKLETLNEPSINSSTSADNLGPYAETKKEKKTNLFKKIFRKKEKLPDCMKQEREKSKGFRKHLKAAAAVAN